MISILRTETPEFLDTSKRQLKAKDYQKESILEALMTMQHSKCCFCETRLTDLGTTMRWVEHIKPKNEFKDTVGKIDWNQANAWSNLLFSCATCNRKKGTTPLIDATTGKYVLVDPSHPDIDPEKHITFYVNGPIIGHKAVTGSDIGKETVEKLFMGRVELYRIFKIRKAEIDATFTNIDKAIAANDKSELERYIKELSLITCSKIAYAGFVRAYIRLCIASFNEENLPKLNNHFNVNFEKISVKIASGHMCLT